MVPLGTGCIYSMGLDSPKVVAMKRKGFTLIELLVVIAIIALLIGILLPALGEARRQGKLAICNSNYHQFATATGTYSADFQDRIWANTWQSKNWQSQMTPTNPVPGGVGTNDLEAAATQSIDIIRRRGNRNDLTFIAGWIPHVLYTHLVLQDYLAARLPEKMVVCPEDTQRLNWQIDPTIRFDSGFWLPFQEAPSGNTTKRWPYSSSYQVVPASYDRTSIPANRIHQSFSATNTYFVSTAAVLGGSKLGDVEFPALKVQLNDNTQRHYTSRDIYYAETLAQQPLLTFDGSARVLKTKDANQGWVPTTPASASATQMTYTPKAWEAPTTSGATSVIVKGYYRWTRGGLKGVDFAGSEIDTGQP